MFVLRLAISTHVLCEECSFLFFSRPDPRVGHTMDVLSSFIPVVCHSDWLFHVSVFSDWVVFYGDIIFILLTAIVIQIIIWFLYLSGVCPYSRLQVVYAGLIESAVSRWVFFTGGGSVPTSCDWQWAAPAKWWQRSTTSSNIKYKIFNQVVTQWPDYLTVIFPDVPLFLLLMLNL